MNIKFVRRYCTPYATSTITLFQLFLLIRAQSYGESHRYKSNQRYMPNPVYPDAVDYPEAQYNSYDDVPDRNLWAVAGHPQINIDAALKALNSTPTWVPNWPKSGAALGQVTAVSIDTAGRVVAFHRATRIWDTNSFTLDNRYWNTNEPPIDSPTIAIYNSSTGVLLEHWGQNFFYMPHGLTVDSKNNVWVTDVALHQVMKFPAGEKSAPSLTLGVRFIPGNDEYHFCKPTAVAVLESGDFFVSDGYCNSRIIKYEASGRKILQWGRSYYHAVQSVQAQPYYFNIPHALALAEDKGLICVADRENGRIQCFNHHNGTFVTQFHSPVLGSKLYSVAYSPVNGGQLYIVSGPEFPIRSGSVHRGFVVNINTRKILSQFSLDNKDFTVPHDVAVSRDGTEVYVAEIDPYKIYKFYDYELAKNRKMSKVKKDEPMLTQQTTVKLAVSTAIPVKPTATVDGVPLIGSTWGGWAGVAGGVAGGLGAVLLLLLAGAALLLKARHRGGTFVPEKECLVDDIEN